MKPGCIHYRFIAGQWLGEFRQQCSFLSFKAAPEGARGGVSLGLRPSSGHNLGRTPGRIQLLAAC